MSRRGIFAEYPHLPPFKPAFAWKRGMLVAGVDEVGRGPLAGAVVTAAVILNPKRPVDGLADSKVLTPKQRETLAGQIREHALAWSLGRADVHEIDDINIYHATLLAMQRAVAALPTLPEAVLVDGNKAPEFPCVAQAVVGGDACCPCISAASILAKVARDQEMRELHERHPEYGFARHKGYATREHLDALARLGPIPEHRQSFGPVAMARDQGVLFE